MSESKPNVKPLFAEFGVRGGAVIFDMIILGVLLSLVANYIISAMGLGEAFTIIINISILVLYFSGFWISPMRSTPAQFLLGMRVVINQNGQCRLI